MLTVAPCTSSFVSTLPSALGLGLRASRGAVTLDRHTVRSGGGPPLGTPRMTTESPDRTCNHKTREKSVIDIYFDSAS